MSFDDYRAYVKRELWAEFKRACEKNSKNFYSCGCILTAHLVMQDLMQHTEKEPISKERTPPKEAWESAMKQTPYHSGYSAAFTATIIAKYSPRGDEFREWCIKDEVVMVNWKGRLTHDISL